MINTKERTNNTQSYACLNKNEKIRRKSSSGGLFTLLAEKIIDEGGIVFGASFTDDFELVHSFVENKEELAKFRGSKYLQSKIGDSFKQVKEFLKEGRNVLFSGTPCQIAGLLAYLDKDYENLICVDLICYGVPSFKVFKLYKEEMEKEYNSKVNKIAFRHKKYGWELFSLYLSFENGKEYIKDVTKDPYLKGFVENLYLRPSCYDCKFRTLNRLRDITIADCWGIENIDPQLNDDKGLSLALTNSNKGKKLFSLLKDKMVVKEIDLQKAIEYNSAATEPVPKNPKRDEFFSHINSSKKQIIELIDYFIED